MGYRKSDVCTQQQPQQPTECTPLLVQLQAPSKAYAVDVQPSAAHAATCDNESNALNTQHQHLASDAKTFASAIIAFLGSGVLGFPFAFQQAGVLLGLVLLVLVGAVSTFCMLLVVDCKYKLQARGIHVATYGDIGRAAIGRTGQWLVNVALVVSQTGFGVAYLIFIAVNAHAALGIAKSTVVLAILPFAIAFALVQRLEQLAFVAFAADCLHFCGLAVVYATDFAHIDVPLLFGSSTGTSTTNATINWLGAIGGAPFFVGVASYCFAGIGMALPLEQAMHHKRHFPRILTAVAALVGVVYATFGICGYVAFGAATRDVVTLNLDADSAVATIVQLCLSVGLLCAYPMMLFPVFQVVQPMRSSSQEQEQEQQQQAAARDQAVTRIASRSSLVLLTAAIAAGVPDFGLFISFLGSTCCSLLGFVLPVVFYDIVFYDTRPAQRYPRSLLALILVVGLCAVVTGFYTALHHFV